MLIKQKCYLFIITTLLAMRATVVSRVARILITIEWEDALNQILCMGDRKLNPCYIIESRGECIQQLSHQQPAKHQCVVIWDVKMTHV